MMCNQLERADCFEQKEKLRAELAEANAMLGKYHEALNDLVVLKDYKDQHGKDASYQELQPGCWGRARDCLRKAEAKDE